MNWTLENWEAIVGIMGGVVIVSRLIVKLTPTPKDDAFLAKVIELLKHLGLYIPLLMILLLPSCMLGYDMNSNLTGKFDPYFIDKSFDYLVKRQDVKVVKDDEGELVYVWFDPSTNEPIPEKDYPLWGIDPEEKPENRN